MFGGDRRWIALDHRCSDGLRSAHTTPIATPVEIEMETHQLLGRLTQTVPARRDTVGHLLAYRDAVGELFDRGVTVDDQRGDVGGGCWPLDLSGLTTLAGPDPGDPDTWTTADDGLRFFSLGPGWQLLLLADSLEEGAW